MVSADFRVPDGGQRQVVSPFYTFKKFSQIPPHVAKAHPDFVRFYKENDFDTLMNFFEHEISIETGTSEPLIKVNDKLCRWTDIKENLFKRSEQESKEAHLPHSMKIPHGWKYNMYGLVNENAVKWTELKPDYMDKGERRPGEYFVELVSKMRGNIGFSRHCYIRLIDKECKVISVGFCSKFLCWLPFRGHKGSLITMDPYDLVEGKEFKTRIRIKADQYHYLKNRIQQDQLTNNVYFNTITRNCAAYACGLLREININIQNMEFPTEALARRINYGLGCKMPKCVSKAFHYIAMFFRILLSPLYNLGIFVLGGTYTSPDMAEIERKNKDYWVHLPRKPFHSWKSFIDGSNYNFSTGWKVTSWQKKVAEFRKKAEAVILKEKADLKKKQMGFLLADQIRVFESKLADARLDLPSKFLLNRAAAVA